MADISITIGGVERADVIEPASFQLDRNLSSQVDQCTFSIPYHANQTYKPSPLDDVIVTDASGDVIFGGQIVEITEKMGGDQIQHIECICTDYSYEMDGSLVIQVYENMSVNAIIADIQTNFLPAGFTIANVNCTTVIKYIAFNYEQPSKCFQQLAEITGYDWYVDETKDIHFFSKTDRTAPFNLDDTGGKYHFDTLVLHRDMRNLKNTIIVRGGEYEGATSSETVIADGTALIYKQGLRYSNVTVTVNGVSKTVGTDNISDPTAFDCLYNYQEKFVRFKAGTLPASTHPIVVGGNPHIPVIVRMIEPVSFSMYDERAHKIIDKSISSKEGARERAKAELRDYAQQLNDGTFVTPVDGLDVGQSIDVSSAIRGITSETYIIGRMSTNMRNNKEFIHQVTLITATNYGIIEYLQKQLMQKDKEIEIADGEVLDEVYSALENLSVDETVAYSMAHNTTPETATIAETATVQALNYGVQFILSEEGTAPSGVNRQFILDGSILG